MNNTEKTVDRQGVHLTHCCSVHGCKYGYTDELQQACPVVQGQPTEYPNNNGCEMCESDEEDFECMVERWGVDGVQKRLDNYKKSLQS